MRKTILILAMAIGLLSSCKKYDENEGIVLKSKEKLLCKEWVLEKHTQQGSEEYTRLVAVEFNKDGTVLYEYDRFEDAGDWFFIQNKDQLATSTEDMNIFYDIIKLDKESLILEHPGTSINGVQCIYRYEFKN